jgi:small-conductance mechanosensitive channel
MWHAIAHSHGTPVVEATAIPVERFGPCLNDATTGEHVVNNIIYIVGLVVVVIAVLSFFGLR